MARSESQAELSDFIRSLKGLEGLKAEDISELINMITWERPCELPPGCDQEFQALSVEVDAHAETDFRSRLAVMNIPDKIKLALFGNWLCRSVLIMDPNRIIQSCVLRSPRLREGELEDFVQNPNIPEWVLREISKNRHWMKSYSLKQKLVTNPKTPGDIALKWIHFLVKADLRKIAMSKNLPQVVTVTARKLVADLEKKRGGNV